MKIKSVFLISLGLVSGLLLATGFLTILKPEPAAAANAVAPAPLLPSAIDGSMHIIDDFEAGVPGAWFQYGDYGAGTQITTTAVVTSGVPGLPTNTVLSIDYVAAGWGAGTGHDLNPSQDWSAYDGFSFWFRGTGSGAMYRLILSDNKNPGLPGDTAERFAYEFYDTVPGWHYMAIPWGLFFRDYAYQPPGAPNDGLTLTEMWAYAIALPSGHSDQIYLDKVSLFKLHTIDDFEAGVPGAWFQYGDYGSGTQITMTAVVTSGVPGLPTNTVLSIDYVAAGWGAGTGHDLNPSQDWSAYDGFSFWFRGTGSGAMYRLILSDNKNPNLPGDSAERFAYEFYDTVPGWRYMAIPWAEFFRDYAYQPPGAPNDGLTLTEMWAYAIALPTGHTDQIYLDNVSLLGGVVSEPVRVQFANLAYSVDEGGTATVSVTLNMTSTAVVSVAYATADDTAIGGQDYITTSGVLVFPSGSSVQTFTVQTLDDNLTEANEAVKLILSDPVNALLGSPKVASLVIVDNDLGGMSPENIRVVDDFEGGLPAGVDGYGNAIGFIPFGGGGGGVTLTTVLVPVTDSMALPIQIGDNHLLQVDYLIPNGGWGGFTHLFTNPTVDTWVSQDWKSDVGVSFWVYGTGSGGDLNFDIFDNKTTTGDSCERFTYIFTDNFTGWKYFEVPFTSFVRKGWQPGGAPDDGLTLTEVWGYAFGFPANVGARTNDIDKVGVMLRTTVVDNFTSGVPQGVDGYGNTIGFVTWGSANNTALTTTVVATDTDPLALPIPLGANTLLQVDYDILAGGWGGFTHLFTNAAVDTWVSQNWKSYEGISFWVYGTGSGGDLNLDLFDNKTTTGDSCERFTYIFKDNFTGWRYMPVPFALFERKGWQPGGAPNDGLTLTEVWGYAFGFPAGVGARTNYLDLVTVYGNVYVAPEPLKVAFTAPTFSVDEGQVATITVALNQVVTYPVAVDYAAAGGTATPVKDYIPVSGTLSFAAGVQEQSFTVATVANKKYKGDLTVDLTLSHPVSATLGTFNEASLTIVELDPYDPGLLDDFESYPYFFKTWGNVLLSSEDITPGSPMALPGQGPFEGILKVDYSPVEFNPGPAGFGRTFAQSQNWSGYDALSFWYYGQNTGKTVTVTVQDNRQPDPGPSGWTLAWSDEFSGTAGTPPDPKKWSYDLGGEGWGNAEWEYYTDSTDNSALDGAGNLVITATKVDTATTQLSCWYGTCNYTSARLLTQNKFEYAYGRAEARLKIPFGQGIWPAFWSLGSNFTQVGWPNSGETDIMENVGKEPKTIHGTIHGPGYSGGNGIGGGYDLPENVSDDFHVFAIEWEPTEIRWYVDGTQYLTVTQSDIPAGTEWVFDHPFFLIMNVAVGGYWPGYPDDTTVFPQTMQVDYVRVYQAPDTAERFHATFQDNFTGWHQVVLPFSSFVRSADQPTGAPDDGFGRTEVWGYEFEVPAGSGALYLDQVAVTILKKFYLPLILKLP